MLEIDHKRACKCRPMALNCLKPKDWLKCQLGVWSFNYEPRDMRDKAKHPATFPISLPTKVIELMTHEGELVVDPFGGSGTTLVACNDLSRNCVGFDLNPAYVRIADSRIPPPSMFSAAEQLMINADAMDIREYIRPGTIKLLMTSPPYANQLNRKRLAKSNRRTRMSRVAKGRMDNVEQYSQNSRDLGTMEAERFADAMQEVFSRLVPLMTEDGQCVVNVGDVYMDGTSIPLHLLVVKALQQAGLEYRNTIIWDKMRLIQKVGIFGYPSNFITIGGSFEYILHFRKPKGIEPAIQEEILR